MTHRSSWLALTVALALAAPAAAQEKFTLKFTKSKQGDLNQVEKAEKSTKKVDILDLAGKVLKEAENSQTAGKYLYRETILEKPADAKKATKLKRHYDKAEEIIDGKLTPLSYQGKTVLIEKKGDKYVFQIEGGAELTGKDAEFLAKEFDKKENAGPDFEKMIDPRRPVAVGESWKIEVADLEKAFGGEEEKLVLDPASKATVTLTRAYKKDGRQFGVLTLDLDLVVKQIIPKDKPALDAEKGSKITLKANLDVCIDGSSDHGSMTANAEYQLNVPLPDQPQLRVSVHVKGDFGQKQTPAK